MRRRTKIVGLLFAVSGCVTSTASQQAPASADSQTVVDSAMSDVIPSADPRDALAVDPAVDATSTSDVAAFLDAAAPSHDGEQPKADTAQPKPDTTQPIPDTTQPIPDAAQPIPDAAQPKPDAAQPKPDAGPSCVPTGSNDLCDGVDNDCDGKTDTTPCPAKGCMAAKCAGKLGCQYQPTVGNDCSDGDPCTVGDKCGGGKCGAGSAKKCSDGNACNGLEKCDPKTGNCMQPAAPKCPYAPAECGQAGGSGDATKDKLTTASAAGFRMTDEDLWASSAALITKIGAHSSTKVVALSTVLTNLNRTGTKITSVPSVKCFARGFKWNSGDSGVDYWWPQGITGSWDGYASGTYAAKKVLIATWYHKPEEDSSTNANKGGRLSIADVSSTGGPKYRNVLLVEPYADQAGKANFKPIVFHAGGAAWYGNHLFIPHTTKGLRVFDISRFIAVKTGDKALVGWSAKDNAYYGHNYAYVLPQVGFYSLCKTCCARFSFVGLDRSTTPARLLTGEYAKSDLRGRLHRWPLDAGTAKLQTTANLVQSDFALFPGVRRMQGALSIGSEVWISSSDKYPGTTTIAALYRYANVGSSVLIRRLPRVPEDVSYHKQEAALWTMTELPDKRYVWSMPEAKLPTSACK